MFAELPDDPLTELHNALARGEAPPLAWVVAHAPDGSLQRVWDASHDVVAMIDMVAATASTGELTRFAAASARALAPPDLAAMLEDSLRLAERWADGESVTRDDLRLAARRVAAVHLDVHQRGVEPAIPAARAAVLTLELVLATVNRPRADPRARATQRAIATMHALFKFMGVVPGRYLTRAQRDPRTSQMLATLAAVLRGFFPDPPGPLGVLITDARVASALTPAAR